MTTNSICTGTLLSGGRYEITEKLGVGGMATVYLAHDNNLNVSVAIKFPDPNLLQNADFRDRFLQETRSLVSLRHPNILKIIDVGQQDGTPYAVMDYLSGGSVNDQRYQDTQGNYLPVVPVFFDKWLNRIADALDFIHRKGYVHRDIKPDNILFDDHGNAFLSDFGIAKVYEETKTTEQANLTRTGMLIGTPEYMAPEISLGQKYDGRSDQYSLAVLVYELLVGSRPFIGATPAALVMKQMQKEFHQLSELQRRWGESVSSVLTRALATDPGERFASCREFEDELTRAFAHTPDRHIDECVVSKCPTCSAPIAIQPEWIGKIARCNKCSEQIHIQATGMVVPASAISAIPPPMLGSVSVTNQQPAGPSCPGCDTVLHITADLRGKKVTCAACEMLLRVSEDGSYCIAATTASVTPTLNNQSLEPFADTSQQGLASISSTYISPIPLRAKAKPSGSKSRLIAVTAGMTAILGIGVWFFMTGNGTTRIAATSSKILNPPATNSSTEAVTIASSEPKAVPPMAVPPMVVPPMVVPPMVVPPRGVQEAATAKRPKQDAEANLHLGDKNVEAERQKQGATNAAFPVAEETRQPMQAWRTQDGTYAIVASYVSQNASDVILRKGDGSEVTVPKSRLAEMNVVWLIRQQFDDDDRQSEEKTQLIREGLITHHKPATGDLISIHNLYKSSPIAGLFAGLSLAAIENEPKKAIAIFTEASRRIKAQREIDATAHHDTLVAILNNLAVCELMLGRPSPASNYLVLALGEAGQAANGAIVHNANLVLQASDKPGKGFVVATNILGDLRLRAAQVKPTHDLTRYANLLIYTTQFSPPNPPLELGNTPIENATIAAEETALPTGVNSGGSGIASGSNDKGIFMPNIWCLVCSGRGMVPCINPRCQSGGIPVKERIVVGKNHLGDPLFADRTNRVSCSTCDGAGGKRCANCDRGKVSSW